MGKFKNDFYSFLKKEIDSYEEKESKKTPFLYDYLRQKKEADPRLVILNAYRRYLQNGCSDPRALISTALSLLCKGDRSHEKLPGLEQLTEIAVQTGAVPSGRAAAALFGDAQKREHFLESTSPEQFSPGLCKALAEDVRAAFPYNEKRNDRYIQLQEQALLFRCTEDPDIRQHFLYLLDFLLAGSLPVTGEIFSIISAVWEKLRQAVPERPAEEFPASGRVREQFRKRVEVFRALAEEVPDHVLRKAVSPEALHELAQQLLLSLIKKDAAAWMYDAGYPLLKRAERSSGRLRKADHTMDLLDVFFRERGEAFGGGASAVFDLDQSRGDIAKLFSGLNKEDKGRNVIVPLAIDSDTGTGLYIIGIDHLKMDRRRGYGKDHSCCYNVVYPSQWESFDKDKETIAIKYDIQSFESKLDDAYYEYAAFISDKDEAEGSACYFFRRINGSPPEGCPLAYVKYFKERTFREESISKPEEDSDFKAGKRSASSTLQI